MTKKTLTKTAAAVLIFFAICALAAWTEPPLSPELEVARWYSIVPPLLTIVLAFLTRNVLLSIVIAIVTGGLLTTLPCPPGNPGGLLAGLRMAVSYPVDALTSIENLKILAFIPPIFAMVEIIVVSGGIKALLRNILPLVKTARTAQAATALMGLIYFIDDYSNAVIVGSSMRPVTDRFGISREKLAFLVDATSAPITSLAVISTWIAYEVGLFVLTAQKLGIEKDGYAMFFDAIAFRFYCILMLCFVFGQILFGCEFGPMKKAQDRARIRPSTEVPPETGAEGTEARHPGSVLNALVPLAGLIFFHLGGLWLDGGGPAKITSLTSVLHWHYWRQVISDTDNSITILIYAALFGLTLAALCAGLTRALGIRDLLRCTVSGVRKCLLPCLVLISAWSLKNSCDSLGTDRFLAHLLSDNISPCLFPALVFLIASATSFGTGTSWGTMIILIPTAVPIAFALDGHVYGLTTVITLGAVLDGAIFGDHCSPLSDTTIISSIASRCDHLQHVRTQLPYSLFVAALALFCGYIPAACGLSPRLSIAAAITVMVTVFWVLTRISRPQRGDTGG